VPHWASISRRRSILVAIAFALLAVSALAQPPAESDPPSPNAPPLKKTTELRTITTLREAHSLSPEQAARGYPIHVRAIVTYFDTQVDSRRIALFLHDGTGGIYAGVPRGTTWPGHQPTPGSLVDVTGISAPGDYAPIIDRAHVTFLSPAHLPSNAQPVTLSTLLTGTKDCQWVQIEGVVHAVFESPSNIALRVAMDGGTITATTVRQPGVDYQSLVDKWATIRGTAVPIFNTNRQLTGARMYFPGLETVSAVAPDQGDAFLRPVQPANTLLRFDPSSLWPHRVHVHGAVALYWPGRTLCIQLAGEGLCAQTSQTTPLAPGAFVDLVGFVTPGGFKPALQDAVFRPIPGSIQLRALPITPEQALQGDHDSDLVQVDGRLIGRNLSVNNTGLLLSSGKFAFLVHLPGPDPALAAIPMGSDLRLTGICSVEVDTNGTLSGNGFTQAASFTIRLQSPHNIVILHSPPWWTADRIGFALLFTLATTVAGIIWVLVLRRRVEQQTRELRQSRELYRHMANHDALTGLATRTLLHDRLQIALDRAQRFRKSIALLMLDLDKFKQINDYYGHSAGDEVLRVTAERIRATIRKTDSVARMGGDEFIVLLTDLAHSDQAAQIAAKIVAALSEPVRFGEYLVPISVSIGVCTLVDESADAQLLLRRVDAAMYRAKARGRGRFHIFTDDMAASDHIHQDDPFSVETPLESEAHTV
jgi:diguanylate cyclase (GGDEF)-like protein